MSGGVGPACDITLPKDELHEPHLPPAAAAKNKLPPPPPPRFLTFRQLNALAVVIVLSASGMVALEDSAFVLFSILYIYFIAKVAFPSTSTSPHPDLPLFTNKNTLLTLHTSLGSIIGLFLPIAYIFEGIYEGDKEGIKAAAPHVFLLASQVFMEGVSYWAGYSIPIRVLVPVVYNGMRMFSILEWVRSEVTKEVGVGYGGGGRRLYVGRGLAVANMAFWSFNLFGFLLPFCLPKAFKMYYGKDSNSKFKD
ncbi:hypothetical protein BUALT_Bualt01G0072300 [Buddleja alternifolia]|uniref:DUF7733 domain-containing protein n=1 Tax=Buddleja alternifolia TaxID=168488 RepID=A0AAV6Y654_9LAMI|nr:hypothetical protein BUALT_Bualt01G0072300 [Buddleja alternifolia]